MKNRSISIILIIALITFLLPFYSSAEDTVQDGQNPSDAVKESTYDYASVRAIPGNTAQIMQGNTEFASDCHVFRNGLLNSGYNYQFVFGFGWNLSTGEEELERVTEDEFIMCRLCDVGYYSGHGGWTTVNSKRYPQINYIPSNPSQDFGESDPINVASAFNVDSDDWMTSSIITENDRLKVLILASCYQLDSSIVKYYARIMKASGVRVVAGYHDLAPAAGDDVIASNFLSNASAGNSVWYSWQHANSGYNWAVLVYEDNFNQYYRLPGFPGNTYEDPSSTAQVYRYASFLDGYQVTDPTSIEDISSSQLLSLPLTITTTDSGSDTFALSRTREISSSSVSIPDASNEVLNYLSSVMNEDISSKKSVQYYVSREEVDAEIGIVPDTEVIVERTYNYYDTYNGVKIADSFIGASIDSDGIKNVTDNRKVIVSFGSTMNEMLTNFSRSTNYISEEDAIKIVYSSLFTVDTPEYFDISLAYAPSEGGTHVLCYEIMTSAGFYYVKIDSGEIVVF